MSIPIERQKPDAKPVNPIIGDLLLSVNHMPIIQRSVSSSQKTDTIVELTQIAAQLWKLFDAAASLTLEFCSKTPEKNDIILFFTR